MRRLAPLPGAPRDRVAPARVAPARVAPARVAPARVAPAGLAAILLLAACGGGSAQGAGASAGGDGPAAAAGAAGAGAGVAPSPLPTCATPVSRAYRWPSQVPQDLPRLPGATLESTRQLVSGLTIVQFSTATSLRDGVLFIVRSLPTAGYALGRGDAEAAEADAPFAKDGLRGVLRGAAVGTCQTKWVLAVTRQTAVGGNPLLPTRPHPSPSPLPFG